jgi:hypothetical protein
MVGLDASNFIVTEYRRSVGPIEQVQPEGRDAVSLVFIIEASSRAAGREEEIGELVADLLDAVPPGSRVALVSAGSTPAVLAPLSRDIGAVFTLARSRLEAADTWQLDQAIRLAASEVVTAVGHRMLILITMDGPGQSDFDDYSLDVCTRFLANNGIVFSSAFLTKSVRPAGEVEYMSRETAGTAAYAYRSVGVAPLVESIAARPPDRYYLRYRSPNATDFGRTFIPLEVEVIYFGRSGRAETGYYAPLEF